jgi:hypothetical protein
MAPAVADVKLVPEVKLIGATDAVPAVVVTDVNRPVEAVVAPIEVLLIVDAATGLIVKAPVGLMATVPVPVGLKVIV